MWPEPSIAAAWLRRGGAGFACHSAARLLWKSKTSWSKRAARGNQKLPKIPEGARPLPEILEGAHPLPEILEGAWCQRRRQSFSVRRAWTWRWPRQCPWSPLSPLVNWHQAELATGGEGREGGQGGQAGEPPGQVSGHNSHLQSQLGRKRPSPVWLAVMIFFFLMTNWNSKILFVFY